TPQSWHSTGRLLAHVQFRPMRFTAVLYQVRGALAPQIYDRFLRNWALEFDSPGCGKPVSCSCPSDPKKVSGILAMLGEHEEGIKNLRRRKCFRPASLCHFGRAYPTSDSRGGPPIRLRRCHDVRSDGISDNAGVRNHKCVMGNMGLRTTRQIQGAQAADFMCGGDSYLEPKHSDT